MARIRTIKPEFPQSETVGKLSRDARLLFVQLWTIVDDEGRARANSRMLASLLYPYDDDASRLIDGWIDELEANGCVRRYEADGSHFLDLPNWLKHQKIDKPSASKLPAFNPSVATPREPSRTLQTDLVPRTSTKDLGEDRSLRSRSAREQDVELDLEFETHFWPEYQHKVGKPDAVVAFRKARRGEAARGKPPRSPTSLETVMAGLARYIATKPNFWMNPATFLNGEHYHDQPASNANAANGKPAAVDRLFGALAAVAAEKAGERERQASPDGRSAADPRTEIPSFADYSRVDEVTIGDGTT